MSCRSCLLPLAGVAVLLGSALAQVPGGAPSSQDQRGTQPGPGGPGSNPQMSTPGTMPEQQRDPLEADKRFVRDAAEGAMSKVELGKLAQEKGSSDAVKEFGKRMVDDHSKAAEELKQVAAKTNISLPSELPRKTKKAKEKLSKLSGSEFDKAYAKMMLKDHKADVKDFENESKRGNIAEVKEFAAKNLPTLQEHLKLAEQMDASVKGNTQLSKK